MSRLEAALVITTVAVSVVGCSAAEVTTAENNRIVTTASQALAECASKSTADLVFTIPSLEMWIQGYQSGQLTFNNAGNETLLEEFAFDYHAQKIAVITIHHPNTPEQSYSYRYLPDNEVPTYQAGFRCAGLPRPDNTGAFNQNHPELFAIGGNVIPVVFPVLNPYGPLPSLHNPPHPEA